MTRADTLDDFLADVRRNLRALPRREADETVAELRSHVLDATGGDLAPEKVGPALAALGEPSELARLNAAARLASGAADSRSPWRLLATMGRIASLSLGGACALLIALIGYATAAAFIITAVVKPFVPSQAGLWRSKGPPDSYSYSLGVTNHPGGVELLGWWIIPVGLLVGASLAWCTFRYCRWSLRRLARRSGSPA